MRNRKGSIFYKWNRRNNVELFQDVPWIGFLYDNTEHRLEFVGL